MSEGFGRRDDPQTQSDQVVSMDALERAVKGDVAALETILRSVRPAAVRTARWALGRIPDAADLAEDVAQDALLQIAQNLVACRAQTPKEFSAWCARITRNLATDCYREPFAVATPLRCSMDTRSVGDIPGELAVVSIHDLTSAGEGLDEDASLTSSSRMVDTLRAILVAVIRETSPLGESARLVILGRLADDATWAQLASELGTTPAGAKRRYQRAITRLRNAAHVYVRGLPKAQRRQITRQLEQWEASGTGPRSAPPRTLPSRRPTSRTIS